MFFRPCVLPHYFWINPVVEVVVILECVNILEHIFVECRSVIVHVVGMPLLRVCVAVGHQAAVVPGLVDEL